MMVHDFHSKGKTLLRWIRAGLAAVDPVPRVADVLREQPMTSCDVLAFGKAAIGMARGASEALGKRIDSALIIGPDPMRPPVLPVSWQYFAGNHPVPGEQSLIAGEAVKTLLGDGGPHDLLVLLSGGGSAMVEVPVEGFALPELQRVNRWLLAAGIDIRTANCIRARFSCLKRGGLLRLAGRRRVTGLVISDVPGDHVADVASGPLSPGEYSWPDNGLPGWLNALHESLPKPPAHMEHVEAGLLRVARNADALDAISRSVSRDGVPVVTRMELCGDALAAGAAIAGRMRNGPCGVYLFGGETTVKLPGSPGRGGRNQHLALAAAREISGCEGLLLAAIATDGVDGNSHDAGAIVDSGTVARIREAGLDPQVCLAGANSNAALAAAGDLVHTGPTGTNVADIIIGWKT